MTTANISDQENAHPLSRARLGQKLRLARHAQGLTLKGLAMQSGCSESMLSKIENGHVLPSLPLIHRLVGILELNISWLFEEMAPEDAVVFRKGKRPRIKLDINNDGSGITLERIVPYGKGHLLQCTIHHMDVGGQSGDAITHSGEEAGYVLRGHVELTVDENSYLLQAGDAFCFPSSKPHAYANIGNEQASILWICTPPTF